MYCRPSSTLYCSQQATVMNWEQAESLDYCMQLQLHSLNTFYTMQSTGAYFPVSNN